MQEFKLDYWEWRSIPMRIVYETYETWTAKTHAEAALQKEAQRKAEAKKKRGRR